MPDSSLMPALSEAMAFAEKHRSCAKARTWMANWTTLAEAWDNCYIPDWLIGARINEGFDDTATLRVWACWCVRQVAHLMTAPESRQALDMAEQFVEGKATAEELADVAGPAARVSAEASWPTPAAAWAARAAAELAALRIVPAARAATEALAWTSEDRVAAWPGIRMVQADKLRELIHPHCKGGPPPEESNRRSAAAV